MSKSSKGSSFEREVCKQLGRWWTSGERDDIYWRTAGSGGRATTRRKRGRGTYGAAGDIKCDDPIGAGLTKAFTFELKRGYNRTNVANLFDRPARAKNCEFTDFLCQAANSATENGTPFWMLIHRRDSRQAMAYVPHEFMIWWRDHPKPEAGAAWSKFTSIAAPLVRFRAVVRQGGRETRPLLWAATLEHFLAHLRPAFFHADYLPA